MTNVVIPLAGTGSRYAKAGYDLPKPLIDIKGMSAVQRVVWGAGIGGKLIYIVQAEQNKKHGLSELFLTFSSGLETVVLEVDEPTSGPLASALVAKEHINNNDLLVIYDFEGIVTWDPNNFLTDAGEGRSLDVSIAVSTFKNHSGMFVETGKNSLVTTISEKSSKAGQACAGVYYWRYGRDFVTYAESVLSDTERANEEFHVSSACAKAVEANKTVGVYQVDNFISLSDPIGLEDRIAFI
jgi:dTDP-glucose pyrophosphorylase